MHARSVNRQETHTGNVLQSPWWQLNNELREIPSYHPGLPVTVWNVPTFGLNWIDIAGKFIDFSLIKYLLSVISHYLLSRII